MKGHPNSTRFDHHQFLVYVARLYVVGNGSWIDLQRQGEVHATAFASWQALVRHLERERGDRTDPHGGPQTRNARITPPRPGRRHG